MEFPIKGILNGIKIVIIPEAEFDRHAGTEADGGHDVIVDPAIARVVDRLRVFGGPRSPIDTDRPLALFLANAGLSMTIANARAACLERFGEERTPSTSAISRYWQRLRNR